VAIMESFFRRKELSKLHVLGNRQVKNHRGGESNGRKQRFQIGVAKGIQR
jgi:hypothetical protein